jgi:hypothetical protein
MSIDNCNRCHVRLDTDFIEYQPDGSLYCDYCLDELDEERTTEVIEQALKALQFAYGGEPAPSLEKAAIDALKAVLAKRVGQ